MAAFPPPPTTSIDWANVGFKIREVNGHIESSYSRSTGQWSPLRFVRDPYVRLHGMSPALNYGQQAFEGLKAFRLPGDDAIAVFRPDRNALRMQHSADVASMPPVPEQLFVDACRAAVALNAEFVPPHDTGAAVYIRPQMYGSSAQLGLTAPDEYMFCVFVVPTGTYHGSDPASALILDEFDRAAPHGTGSAKLGGNYAPVLRWSDRARADGFGITLHLDSARHEDIDEFSTSGFIGVLRDGDGDGDNVSLVVPDSHSVIESVTSDSIQHIARSFGWAVHKRPIKYAELPSFAEVCAAGTAAALVPIRSITRRGTSGLPAGPNVSSADGAEKVTYIPDSQNEPGPVFTRLLDQLKAIQLGKVDDSFGWRVAVSAADGNIEGAPKNGQVTPAVGQMD